ncbi:tetratricopeptide repeat protein [Aquabacterium sp.]|uniref:O-linked N-acetylglucosamine transferase, SPINDLY family protein n=1 Tax=Aquabacterium sp. TaxID=1872578 RepID=UPI0025C31001|nr:tetratricopeptide repeat protein [Aquabacterium sp.]
MTDTLTAPLPTEAPAPVLDQQYLIEAVTLQGQGQDEEAERRFRRFLMAQPNDPVALYSLCVILLKRRAMAEALAHLAHGTQVAPHFAPLWAAYASALHAAGQRDAALAAYDQALALKPDYIEALINSGTLLRESHQHMAALERFNRVLAINPDYETALGNCAILLTEFKRSEQAIGMFQRLLHINPNYDYGLGLLSYERMHICDWTDFDTLVQSITDGVRASQRVCKSLGFMAINDQAADHLLCARTFAAHKFPPTTPLWTGERYRHDRIRIAYVSPDLREHPVGHLMAGIFEQHDKRRFETIAISLGIDDQSRLRERMLRSFDHFLDARLMGSADIARRMREMEVDIAIDLAGYTSDSRTDVFSHRPAPVQVNYLGYPGTLGLDCIDYLIADRHVIPPAHQAYYDEKVVYLPDSYLPAAGGIQIAERTPTRAECGLPDEGVVFCSFNHDYKIAPHMFTVWMRLLREVPGSVLWLMSRNEVSQRNLRAHAQAQGVAPERLVFAQRVPRVEDHLARYRQADLFLDTHPYNAHTTAADALMAGLPVVTYMGQSFPSRVAGSLLHTAGLPELATASLADYEALALALARDPARRQTLKDRLAAQRQQASLFDSATFCRQLETIYTALWRQAQLGTVRDELGA